MRQNQTRPEWPVIPRPALLVAVSCLLILGGVPANAAGLPTGQPTSGGTSAAVDPTRLAVATNTTVGFGSMTVDGVPATGERPVLVILLEYEDVSFDAANTPGSIDAMFTETRQYFTENSGGTFTWDSRVVGPFTHPDDPSTDDIDESLFNCAKGRKPVNGSGGCPGADAAWYDNHSTETQLTAAIERAAEAEGVDLAAYDDDDDGYVTPDELTVVMVTAEPAAATDDIPIVGPGGGAARAAEPDACVDVGTVSVCTFSRNAIGKPQVGAVMLDEWTKFTTVAHELSHTLGTVDLYGANARLNSDLTLMDATIGEDKRYHLDPWHKIQLGWAEPRIYRIDDGWDDPQCAALAPLGERGPVAGRDDRQPIIIYSPLRYDSNSRTGEFYILEQRTRTSFDADVADEGLALWYVSVVNGEPRALPSTIVPDGGRTTLLTTMPSGDDVNTTVGGEEQIHAGPNGRLDTAVATDDDGEPLDKVATDRQVIHVSPGFDNRWAPTNYTHRMADTLWQAGDGDIRPKWFGGELAGPPLSVAGTDDAGNLVVDLNTRAIEIDSPVAASWDTENDESFALLGYFGHNGTASGDELAVRVVGGIDRTVSRYRLDWSCERLEVTPFYYPPGVYQVFVEDPENGASSNRIDLFVRRGVTADHWRGTYTGSLDGRAARLTIRAIPGNDFTDEIVLVDDARGVTYTGTVASPARNAITDLELTSAGGETLRLDSLVIDLEGHDHLAGLTTGGTISSRGLAFSDAANWTSSVGSALVADDPATWTDQWTGDYEGSLDGRPATLSVTGGEHVEFGTLRPGEGYRFELELVDESFGITYHGSGVIDTTGGRSTPHILEVSELTTISGFTSGNDRYETLDDVQFRLHTMDTSRISGVAMVGDHSPGYGPKAMPYAFHFRGATGLKPELAAAISALGPGDIPWYARPLLRGERVNIHLPEGSFGIEMGSDGTPETIHTSTFADQTLDIHVSDDAVVDVQRAANPQQAVVSAVRTGEIEYKTAGVIGQFKYGVVRVAVEMYAIASSLGERLRNLPVVALR